MLPASGQLSYEPMIDQFSCDIVQLLPLYMFFWWGRGGGGSIANDIAFEFACGAIAAVTTFTVLHVVISTIYTIHDLLALQRTTTACAPWLTSCE